MAAKLSRRKRQETQFKERTRTNNSASVPMIPGTIPPELERILEKAPAEVRTTVLMSMSQYYQGPLPPPNFIEGYNLHIPNGGDRLMTMVEKQVDHRIRLESKVIESDVKRANLGLIIGSFITFGALAGAFVLILGGKSVEGGLFGGAPLLTLVGLFLKESKSRSDERREKSKSVPQKPGGLSPKKN